MFSFLFFRFNVFPTTYSCGYPFLTSLSAFVVNSGFELFGPPRAGGTRVIIAADPSLVFILIEYNIGTEILMLKRNLHNSTLRGRTEKSLNGNHTVFYALYDQLGPRAVAAT